MKESLPPDGSIDAGLLLLSLATPRGHQRTLGEIATACGCLKQKIYYIEQQALKKIRRELENRGVTEGLF